MGGGGTGCWEQTTSVPLRASELRSLRKPRHWPKGIDPSRISRPLHQHRVHDEPNEREGLPRALTSGAVAIITDLGTQVARGRQSGRATSVSRPRSIPTLARVTRSCRFPFSARLRSSHSDSLLLSRAQRWFRQLGQCSIVLPRKALILILAARGRGQVRLLATGRGGASQRTDDATGS